MSGPQQCGRLCFRMPLEAGSQSHTFMRATTNICRNTASHLDRAVRCPTLCSGPRSITASVLRQNRFQSHGPSAHDHRWESRGEGRGFQLHSRVRGDPLLLGTSSFFLDPGNPREIREFYCAFRTARESTNRISDGFPRSPMHLFGRPRGLVVSA